MKISLHGYHASSSTWRVKNMLAFKKILYVKDEVDIIDRLDHLHKNFHELASNQKVPCLEIEDEGADGQALVQYMSESVSICEYIEEQFRRPSMMPQTPFQRQKVREFCGIISTSVQPLHSIGTLRKLESDFGVTDPKHWCQYFIESGLKNCH
jgi:glutathione S-transferase